MILAVTTVGYALISGGVVIPERGGSLTLRVESPRRVRVMFKPTGAGPAQPNLAEIHPEAKAPFKFKATASSFRLTTSELAITVDKKTGALTYRDHNGKLLLQEPSNARTFAPTAIGDTHAFSAVQRFNMQAGEAYFGLGGHQRSGLNYRGSTVNLVQRNTETAVPFLLSSRGYGVLSNSATAQVVNLGGDSGPIPSENLSDDQGLAGGLTGHYYEGKNFEKHVADRRDSKVDFSWLGGPVDGIGHLNFSVRWTGAIVAPRSGDYRFTTRADDGVRLYVNNKLIVDDWSVKAASEATGHVAFEAGHKYPIRVEYFQAGGESEVSLKWQMPSASQQVVWSSEFLTQEDYTFISGPKFDDIIAEYRKATGPAPLFGRWAYGLWQCKERYQTQQELLDIAKGYRDRRIPLDNIVQDWFYWDPHVWGSHDFDAKRYPSISTAIDTLHAENVHLMISVWGKFLPGSANYDELSKSGYLYPALTGEERYYDAFNPDARAMYWRQITEKLLSKGIDAWWLDASEPEVPMNKFRTTSTHLGPANEVLNAWPLMHTKGVYEGQRKAKPDSRVFILTRSAFPGQQRNAAAVWSGDVQGNWSTFGQQVSNGLNFCMSGLPYWCTDIGGFFSPPHADKSYDELFVRWYEWGTFCPIFRVHGTGTDKEPWRWAPTDEKTLVKFDKLRYKLMPYIYSLAWKVTHEGYTVMRGLPMDFGNDPKVYDIDDEFMFGPSLLIAPVTQKGATSRQVYLPKGKWYDFWTGKPVTGGQTINVKAPLSSIPIFVRAGSILPIGPVVQYASQPSTVPLELWFYPGADGKFTLYEDAGDGYGYERGQYATTELRLDNRRGTLTISDRKGSFPKMPNPLTPGPHTFRNAPAYSE